MKLARMGAAVLVASALVLIGTSGVAEAKTPKGVDSSVWNNFCINLGHFGTTLKKMQKGTLTTGETVSTLASEESDFENDDVSAMNVGGKASKKVAKKVQALADAMGLLKVAISTGADVTPANTALLAAIRKLPKC